ncbi:MAG: SDR family oxidoreductase [Candidatus Competibacteraceae bacterium]|nr:SDR family oxidoreductase [Candidatus Competibacteraceae bacterium]
MSKAAMGHMTRVLAAEWGPSSVRVNAIAPGFVVTDLSRKLWSMPSMQEWVLPNTPLRRLGQPEDLVGAALFLASNAAAWMTGKSSMSMVGSAPPTTGRCHPAADNDSRRLENGAAAHALHDADATLGGAPVAASCWSAAERLRLIRPYFPLASSGRRRQDAAMLNVRHRWLALLFGAALLLPASTSFAAPAINLEIDTMARYVARLREWEVIGHHPQCRWLGHDRSGAQVG